MHIDEIPTSEIAILYHVNFTKTLLIYSKYRLKLNNEICRLAFLRILMRARGYFERLSFNYVQTASAGNEGTRNKKIYDSGDDIDGHA